jgi:cytochrome c-type biogenesis protein CcmH
MTRRLLTGLLFLLPLFATAKEAPPLADDPVLEQRVMKLSSELRCLVCQNQSLADSHADLAIDLRNQVREQMRAGKSDAEIKDWLTQRYGDFVLYRTPLRSGTWLLWFGPFLLLIGGVAGLLLYMKRRRQHVASSELTPQEHARVQALLGPGEGASIAAQPRNAASGRR